MDGWSRDLNSQLTSFLFSFFLFLWKGYNTIKQVHQSKWTHHSHHPTYWLIWSNKHKQSKRWWAKKEKGRAWEKPNKSYTKSLRFKASVDWIMHYNQRTYNGQPNNPVKKQTFSQMFVLWRWNVCHWTFYCFPPTKSTTK